MMSNSTLVGGGGGVFLHPSHPKILEIFWEGWGCEGVSQRCNFIADRKSLRIAKNVIFYYHNFSNKKKITW